MREIKFRSWNIIDDCFYYFENGKYYYFNIGAKVFVKEFVFQWEKAEQYTGLKDKNGVEIYEGDVLGYDFGKVFFSYGAFGIITEWGELHPLAEINEMFIEIIGNIHEK